MALREFAQKRRAAGLVYTSPHLYYEACLFNVNQSINQLRAQCEESRALRCRAPVAWRARYQSGSKQYKTAYFNPILFLFCVLLMLKKCLQKKTDLFLQKGTVLRAHQL